MFYSLTLMLSVVIMIKLGFSSQLNVRSICLNSDLHVFVFFNCEFSLKKIGKTSFINVTIPKLCELRDFFYLFMSTFYCKYTKSIEFSS